MKKSNCKRIHIGMQKAGSTYLYNLLANHPEVSLGSVTEINYFSKNFEKGEDWYGEIFVGGGNRIDTSPKYFMLGEEVTPRMKEYENGLGGERLKMLLIIRNPIDYLFSHFQMHLKHGFFVSLPKKYPKVSNDLIEFVKMYPEYLERAFYFKILNEHWLKYFSLEQFKIVFFEDFIKNNKSVMREILEFWELECVELEAKNISKNKKLKYDFLFRIQNKLIKNVALKDKIKQNKLFNYIYDNYLTENSSEKLSSENRSILKDIFKKDVESLKVQLDLKYLPWKDFE